MFKYMYFPFLFYPYGSIPGAEKCVHGGFKKIVYLAYQIPLLIAL